MSTTITQIVFSSNKSIKRISSFRGAVISSLEPSNTLFHNHDGEALIYAYPLIQYKKIKDNPSIVGINEGAQEINRLWTIGDHLVLHIDGERHNLQVCRSESYCYAPAVSNEPSHTYIIRGWLPFNQVNYHRYKSLNDIHEKISMLARLMTGNILSLLKGLGYWIENEIVVDIAEILKSSTIKYKGIELISLDIKINTNITLPPYCGIGKGASKGYGIISENPLR